MDGAVYCRSCGAVFSLRHGRAGSPRSLFSWRPTGTRPEFGGGRARGGALRPGPARRPRSLPQLVVIILREPSSGRPRRGRPRFDFDGAVFKWCPRSLVDGCTVHPLLLRGRTLRPSLHYFCGVRTQPLEVKKIPSWIELESCLMHLFLEICGLF